MLPVTDLDAASRWYRDKLGFRVLFDSEIFPGFRSVHVGPGTSPDAGIWLFPTKAANDATYPSLVLYSHDLDRDTDRLTQSHAPTSPNHYKEHPEPVPCRSATRGAISSSSQTHQSDREDRPGTGLIVAMAQARCDYVYLSTG